LELGGGESGYVACYAANQVLGAVWRGGREDPDTQEIRDSATLSRLSGVGARDVVEVSGREAALVAARRRPGQRRAAW
jgi:hypothetical protein